MVSLNQAAKQLSGNSKRRTTPKGTAGYDNQRENIDPHIKTQAISTKEFICKFSRQYTSWHAFGGYEDKNYTLVCGVGTWTFVTNAINDLWSDLHSNGITMLNDEIVIANKGHYTGQVTLTISALNGKDYHIRIQNITQTKTEGYPLGISTTGAGNEMALSIPLFLDVNAGDILQMQIKSTDGTDCKLDDAVFYINYLHE